jgi:hypothetical protein
MLAARGHFAVWKRTDGRFNFFEHLNNGAFTTSKQQKIKPSGSIAGLGAQGELN